MFEFGALREPLLYAVAAVGVLHLLALLAAGFVGPTRATTRTAAQRNRQETDRAVRQQGDGPDHDTGPQPPAAEATPTVEPARETDPTTLVSCPSCGTANERGYRFCRACVGELPGADGRAGAGGALLRDSPL